MIKVSPFIVKKEQNIEKNAETHFFIYTKFFTLIKILFKIIEKNFQI